MTATGTYAPFPEHQFFVEGGTAAAAGYRLFTYTAGTSTKVSTYTDVALSVANANPLTLGANGRATLVLQPGISYKFVLAPSGSDDPPLSPTWTRDNVQAVPAGATAQNEEITGVAGETLTANDAVCLSDGSGGGTGGRWYRMDADFTYLSIAAQATGFAVTSISTGASGTIRRGGQMTGLSGLTAGSTYYASATAGAITATPPTNARIVGKAESATVLTIVPSLPDASATVAGQITTGAQTIGATGSTNAKTFGAVPIGTVAWGYMTADQTKNNSAAMVDLAGLSFTIGANESWIFRAWLHGISNGTTADWAFDATGPAAPTAVRIGILGAAGSKLSSVNAFSTEVNFNSANAEEMIILDGFVRNGANAGTVQLRFCQDVATVIDTIVRAESHMIATRVA